MAHAALWTRARRSRRFLSFHLGDLPPLASRRALGAQDPPMPRRLTHACRHGWAAPWSRRPCSRLDPTRRERERAGRAQAAGHGRGWRRLGGVEAGGRGALRRQARRVLLF